MYDPKIRAEKRPVLCEDGTYTLYSKEFDEPYHSTRDGALHESLQKYVIPTLTRKAEKQKLVILDICFGLGYNTLATLYWIKSQGLHTCIEIHSPEFDEGLVRSLGSFDYPPEFEILRPIIETISRDFYYEDAQFKIEVHLGDARQVIPRLHTEGIRCDIIYQDAFSPAHNPLLWTREWFADIRALCRSDAVLASYSTAAAVRLGLYENGFMLFVHRAEMMRYSTLASLKMLEDVETIDMELKKIRNPTAKSLLDADYL